MVTTLDTVHLLACLLLAVVVAGCAPAPNASDPPISGPDPVIHHASVVDVSCAGPAVPTEIVTTCHEVHVGRVRLAVAVLHASDPSGDPVLHLHGGPGGRAVDERHRWLVPRSPLLVRHDVVLVDQRGGGRSTPSLDCPEVDQRGSEPDDLRACRMRLDEVGIDRDAATVSRIATDLVAVRRALGIERWHLHAVSYGTRIAIEVLRIDGGAVRSAVLDSVVPPDVATHDTLPAGVVAAVEALSRWCEGPARRCTSAASTTPGATLGVVLESLANEPAPVTVRSGDTTLVDDVAFLRLVTDALALPAPEGPATATAAIDLFAGNVAADVGLAEAVALLEDLLEKAGLASRGRAAGDALAEGAQLSVECADEMPGNSFARDPLGLPGGSGAEPWHEPVADAAAGRWIDVRTLCALWDVPASDPSTRLPADSDVPVLVLTGLLDPVTPAAWGRHVADHLGDATVVESGTWTHVPSMSDPCAAALVVEFLDLGRRLASGAADC